MFHHKYIKMGLSADDKTVMVLWMYGVVGWDIEAKWFAEAIKDRPSEVTDVHIFMNSPGGLVPEGYAILTNMKRAKAEGLKFTGFIDGWAYSMMSAIAAECDHVVASPLSRAMIHNPWTYVDLFKPINSQTIDEVIEDLQNKKKDLDKDDTILASVYAGRLNMTVDQVKEKYLNGKDVYLDADEMVAIGFADEIQDFSKIGESVEARENTKNLQVFAMGSDEDFKKTFKKFAKSKKNSLNSPSSQSLKNFNNMDLTREIADLLNLSTQASADAVNQAIVNLAKERNQAKADLQKKAREVEDLTSSLSAVQAEKDTLETEVRQTQATDLVRQVVEAVQTEATGKEVNKNITDRLAELASESVASDEVGAKRIREHMQLLAKSNLVKIGVDPNFSGGNDDRGANDQSETLKKAQEEGRERAKARRERHAHKTV